jgi:carbon monoxide dehydrogenase subunit G
VISLEQFIAATPETVWADLSRLQTHVEWMADAEHLEFLTDSHQGVGARFRVATRIGPFRTSDVMTVTVWEPARDMAVTHDGLFSGSGRFVLEPVPGGTRLLWHETIRFPWFLGGGAGALVARPVLTAIWRGNLRRFAARFT